MRVTSIPASELSVDLIERWREILRAEPTLDSPYFRPEFVQAVAACRDDVEIGLLEEESRVVGFFPFQRTRTGVAQTIAKPLCDFQAVIAPVSLPWRVEDILSGCKLTAWEFDHQLASQAQLAKQFARVAPSPWIDLSVGFEGYLAARKTAGARSVGQTLRKTRKLERESAPVEFQWQTGDEQAWQRLIEWKSAQYHRTGAFNWFCQAWVRELLDRLRSCDAPELAGRLSVLSAGSRPVAVHFGLASESVLHYWFPAYDPEATHNSPGLVMLLKLAEAAATQGVRRIDLGKGPEEYKLSFASGATTVAEGAVDRRPIAGVVRTGWRQARDWIRRSPLKQPAKLPLRWLRRVQEWLAPPNSSHPTTL